MRLSGLGRSNRRRGLVILGVVLVALVSGCGPQAAPVDESEEVTGTTSTESTAHDTSRRPGDSTWADTASETFEDSGTLLPDLPTEPGPIRFDALAVGQQSRYRMFVGEGYYGDPQGGTYEYTDDVLVVEVVEEKDTAFVFEEWFESGAEPRDGWLWFFPPRERSPVYRYEVEATDSVLRIAATTELSASWLFQHYVQESTEQLPLTEVSEPEVEVVGWQTTVPYCRCDGTAYIADMELLDASYGRVNVVVDATAAAGDGPAFTHIFSASAGIIRATMTGGLLPTGRGWDLLP